MGELVEAEVEKVLKHKDSTNWLILHPKKDYDSVAVISLPDEAAYSIQMGLENQKHPYPDLLEFFGHEGFNHFNSGVKGIIIEPHESASSAFYKIYGVKYDVWRADVEFSDGFSVDARPSDALRVSDLKKAEILIPEDSLQPRDEIKAGNSKLDYQGLLDRWKKLEKVTEPGRPRGVSDVHVGHYSYGNGRYDKAAVLITSEGKSPLLISEEQWIFYQTAVAGENIGLSRRPDTYLFCSRLLQHFKASFNRITASVSYYQEGSFLPLFSEGPIWLTSPQGDLYARMLTMDALILNERGMGIPVNLSGSLIKDINYLSETQAGQGFIKKYVLPKPSYFV